MVETHLRYDDHYFPLNTIVDVLYLDAYPNHVVLMNEPVRPKLSRRTITAIVVGILIALSIVLWTFFSFYSPYL